AGENGAEALGMAAGEGSHPNDGAQEARSPRDEVIEGKPRDGGARLPPRDPVRGEEDGGPRSAVFGLHDDPGALGPGELLVEEAQVVSEPEYQRPLEGNGQGQPVERLLEQGPRAEQPR